MPNEYNILIRLLQNARRTEYKGYNKHDGLLSPFLKLLFGWNKIGRLAAIQLVTRAPFNIRPNIGVPKTRNPKGIGLFAKANLDTYQLTGDREYLEEAEKLLAWLIEHGNQGLPGISFGYQYPWQDIGFYALADFPNRVVTCWIGYAFFQAWKLTAKQTYIDVCKKICTFLRETDNRIADTSQELCFSYVPDKKVTWAVMDVSALCGKMFALTGNADGNSELLYDAKRSMAYVINRQTDYGAWYYTDPPKDSHITHDNYHDIHGAAQGIITFSKASIKEQANAALADKILSWTLRNLYNETEGVFWYQKTRWRTKRFTLLRWCNAWMANALTEHLISRREIDA